VLVVLLLAITPGVAQDSKDKDKDELHPDIPIQQWLSGPERKDFKWHVDLESPRMTFQQRFLVEVRAGVDAAPLKKDGAPHDLYFVLKVSDGNGHWLPGDTNNHFAVTQKLSKSQEIEFNAGLYAKPGRYTAALLLYDVDSGRGNVWRKTFEVKEPKNDPLPTIDSAVPTVEFLDEVPEELHVERTIRVGRRRFPAPERWTGTEQWPPAHGAELLPVHAARPLRIDVVLNFSPWIDPFMIQNTPAVAFRIDSGRMIQIGAVLSHLAVDRGCVRVAGVDLSRIAVAFEPTDARNLDWNAIAEQVRKTDHNTVSVDVLSKKKSPAPFLHDYMTELMKDSSGCAQTNQKGEHVILFVSHGFEFPSGTRHDPLAADSQCGCRFYYIRITRGMSDDLDDFFKQVNPRRFDVANPEQFRRALAELLRELNGNTPDRPR
jgi:hypothetical protein